MALDDDMTLLARQPLLSLMERDALRLLAFAAESRILRAGDVLFRAGEPLRSYGHAIDILQYIDNR